MYRGGSDVAAPDNEAVRIVKFAFLAAGTVHLPPIVEENWEASINMCISVCVRIGVFVCVSEC